MDRRCCCRKPRVCVFFRDDFTRANSSDLGPKWTVVSGDWSISGNKLVVDSAGGLIRGNTRHPSPDESMCVSAGIVPFDGAARLLVNYKDEDNHLFCRIDFINRTLSIGRRAGGSDLIIREVPTPSLMYEEIIVLSAQFSRTHLSFGTTSLNEGAFDCVDHIAEGYYSGLQSEGGAAMVADGFTTKQHNRTWVKYNPEGICCLSQCQCIAGKDARGFDIWKCIPRTLLLTFSSCTGDLEGTELDGAHIVLENNSDFIGSSMQQWEGRESICYEDWWFNLLCGGETDLGAWTLRYYPTDNFCIDGVVGGFGGNPAEATCDPLSMTFGPFEIVSDTGGLPGDFCRCMPDPGYGSYTITITEAPV